MREKISRVVGREPRAWLCSVPKNGRDPLAMDMMDIAELPGCYRRGFTKRPLQIHRLHSRTVINPGQ